MFRRRIPFNQVAFATLVGVVGGVYIYRPLFEPPRKPPSAPDQDLKCDPEEERAETNKHPMSEERESLDAPV
ncbi:protein PIGBOS1 [Puntigrus tetrazona]|uniref:protein PIGBOS1 n=1 Tax=Puntigrus tetrazona TaxID=1606681 RepID=UPI001C8AC858|nr:protein PIGBOS1 [Puntigrus tetrazona]XP_043072624.1 protein PIGBOS1 [Puntigrus tetrazona]XP_043072625.1 protein PIGBOS1 [Puntigrus tetrazona]XP_043072626.1 protein PIGBOS1 [Puntigrus tetrazona]XP_043072627.1 protein PIGBOS1 [Puntigrus tetrazona]